MSSESQRAEQFCQQVVDHMLHLRGFDMDRNTCSGQPRCESAPGYATAYNDIHYEISGGRDPSLDRIYLEAFTRRQDPAAAAERIQNAIWDR
jgi:hypothetical protein